MKQEILQICMHVHVFDEMQFPLFLMQQMYCSLLYLSLFSGGYCSMAIQNCVTKHTALSGYVTIFQVNSKKVHI